MNNRLKRLETTLQEQFSPQSLSVIDESSKHHGHAGARPEGETHYHVEIKADAFKGLTRVAMHRLINEAVKSEFTTGLHALSLKTSA